MREIKPNFFKRDTIEVAKDLLGKIICKDNMAGKIVEVEAYKNEPGSHAYNNKITPRNKIMFGPPGRLYVYFTYGNHYLMNIVCEEEGTPGAVLIRALEPTRGLEIMRSNRSGRCDLTNGPGKLTQALGIDKTFNGEMIGKRVKLFDVNYFPEIITSTRVGLSQGKDLLLRFYIKGNKWVSKR